MRGETAHDLLKMDEETARLLWKWGGHGTPENFPGARLAPVLMLRGYDKEGRQTLARMFADLAPHSGASAVLALLGSLTRRVLAVLLSLADRPSPIALPAPEPRALSPQRRCHRLTPARAP
ncbi:hypothetical protein ACLQ2D_39950 [Streptomyces sp. DT199]|uniref:hypothetical protein n=1 Tax=Streptomyces sp. DT199 TaxID=3393421 RepID=UPI003CEDC4E4